MNACAVRLLPPVLLLLLTLPAPVKAQFNYTTNNGGIAITGYTGSGGAVTIPATIAGLPVTSIGDYAFESCTSLASATIGNRVTSIGYAAFNSCTSLIRITTGNSVTSIGDWAFSSCTNLRGVYFKGDAPSFGSYVFSGDYNLTVYYLSGTTGWSPTLGGRPVLLWKPQAHTSDASFDVRTNGFGFNIAWASGRVIVVEACTNLANPIWSPLQTNTLSGDSLYFNDPLWTNYPGRFYRLRSQ